MSDVRPTLPECLGSPATGQPPRHFFFDPGNGWVSPFEKLLVACITAVVFFGIFFVVWVSYQLEDLQQRDVLLSVETAQNRAVSCQLLNSQGQPVPDSCSDPEVRKFYNPDVAAPPNRTTGLVCEIGRKIGIPERDLPPVCAEVDGDD